MRKVVLFGFVLVCLSAASFLTVLPIERKVVSPDGTIAFVAAKPTQVEVTNFPAIQQVTGTVTIGNLSQDSEGRLLVRVATPHVVGFTEPVVWNDIVELTTVCASTFPGSRMCDASEVFHSIPPAIPQPPYVRVIFQVSVQSFGSNCVRTDGAIDCGPSNEAPVACCGV